MNRVIFRIRNYSIGFLSFKGVIWYQGESNAHNKEIHEILFPLLVDSWRKKLE